MGNNQIQFTWTFYVFRLLKDITTIWECSNILKLYSVELYQTCKFVTFEENIRQKRLFWVFKTIVFSSFLDFFFGINLLPGFKFDIV